MASLFLRLLDHSQTRATIGRTLLDGWSGRRRELYLIKHKNTHEGKACTPLAGFQPTIPINEWPHTHALDRATTGIGHFNKTRHQNSGRNFSLRSVTCPTHSSIFEVNLKICTIYQSRISIYIIIILPQNRLTSLTQLQSSVPMVYQCFYFRVQGRYFLKRKTLSSWVDTNLCVRVCMQ